MHAVWNPHGQGVSQNQCCKQVGVFRMPCHAVATMAQAEAVAEQPEAAAAAADVAVGGANPKPKAAVKRTNHRSGKSGTDWKILRDRRAKAIDVAAAAAADALGLANARTAAAEAALADAAANARTAAAAAAANAQLLLDKQTLARLLAESEMRTAAALAGSRPAADIMLADMRHMHQRDLDRLRAQVCTHCRWRLFD